MSSAPGDDDMTGELQSDESDQEFGTTDAAGETAPDFVLDPVLLQDAAHVWHPYTQHFEAPVPIAIARAKGAWLYESSGRPILDAISSWSVMACTMSS